MMIQREWNVCVVFNFFVIGWCKVIWVEFFWVVLVFYMVMQYMYVYYDIGFGGNVVVVEGDIFICYVCDCWLWWMQMQGFFVCLFKVCQFSEVFVFYSVFVVKDFVNFSYNFEEQKLIS